MASDAGEFDDEGYLSILGAVEAELSDVEHALARLDDGTYGTCERCGQPIEASRLVSIPAARLCALHAGDWVAPPLF